MDAGGNDRSTVTLVTRPPSWLGGGAYMQQLIDTVERHGRPGDRVVRVGSLRGDRADLRVPGRLLDQIGTRPRRAMGDLLWRGRHVHRVNVDLPPARREILTVMDLAPLHFDDEGRAPRDLLTQVRRARGVVTISRTIADEVMADLGAAHVWVVPPAVADRFFDQGARPQQLAEAPYVLHVGGATQRKGLDRLSAAWPAVLVHHPELRLVMVGPPHPGRDALLAQRNVSWRGLVPAEELLVLMRTAAAVLVPSTYEGFGIPVAESMALGTPVVVLSRTAPAEVGGDVAFAADIDAGSDALADQVLRAAGAVDREPARLLRGQHVAKQYSLGSVRAQQLAVYDEAFG